MALVRWDPFLDLYDLERDMSRLFSRSFRDLPRATVEPMAMLPAVDVLTRGKDLIVRAELPGLTEKDVDVSVDGRTLIVRGDRREEHEATEADYHTREIRYGHFERHIRLPDGVDVDKIHATLSDGVLEVTVPKAAELAGTKKVPIEVGAKHKAILGKKAA